MNQNQFTSVAALFSTLLIERHVTFTRERLYDGWKWLFPDFPYGDVIIHSGSYHCDEGYVESMGMPWDEDDVSVFLPEEMANRIAEAAFYRHLEEELNKLSSEDLTSLILEIAKATCDEEEEEEE